MYVHDVVQLPSHLVPEHSLCPSRKLSLFPGRPHSPSPQPPATTGFLSDSMDLPTLDVSHKWSRMTCVLLCLASLSSMFSAAI